MSNRTTVCAFHHLRGIHGGLAQANGTAPGSIKWDLGLRDGQSALLRFSGERYRTDPA